ncbi:MAG: ATP-binding protein [Treponemataceae bacterium]|nr:ATP-binding protein [Treponemataceae bacterium]
MTERKLPIGIQTFQEIREENFLYIDKTDFVYELASRGKPYFLARPRRFGKSLLISTIKAYFEGRKELFEGLKIAEKEKNWIKYTVLHFDFSKNGYSTHEKLKTQLNKLLSSFEKQYGIIPDTDDEPIRFDTIIETAAEKTGKKIVVLVDEYDKPMLDALNTPAFDKNRMLLRDFFGVLKGDDQYLKFVFITGITKFAKVNIFSEMNQLADISMSEKYGTICGITQQELEENFKPEISAFAEHYGKSEEEILSLLKQKYDGYHFNSFCPDIYNPFSLINSLENKTLESFWFQTATPAMLFTLIENSNYDLTNILDGVTLDSDSFSDYRVGGGSITPIIYHSGYLTIKDYNRDSDLYTLKLPNEEVKNGFLKYILPRYTNIPEDRLGLSVEHFRKAIAGRDIDSLMKLFSAAIADLPTRRSGNMEYAYQVAFHAMLRQTGFDVESEMQVIGGRVDVTLETNDTAYIFELKMDDGKPFDEVAEIALAQIEKKGYAARFSASGKKIFKIALVFSTEKGGVTGYKIRED